MSERGSSRSEHDSFFVRARRDFQGETYLGWWLGLPWRCRLFGHRWKLHEHYNADAGCMEEAWYDCERCDSWGGHAMTLGAWGPTGREYQPPRKRWP